MYIYGNKQTGQLSHPHGELKEIKKAYWNKYGWIKITDKHGAERAILSKQENGTFEFVVVKKMDKQQVEAYKNLGYTLLKDFDIEP